MSGWAPRPGWADPGASGPPTRLRDCYQLLLPPPEDELFVDLAGIAAPEGLTAHQVLLPSLMP